MSVTISVKPDVIKCFNDGQWKKILFASTIHAVYMHRESWKLLKLLLVLLPVIDKMEHLNCLSGLMDIFIISFLLEFYVSVILRFMCYFSWFDKLIFGSEKAQKFFPYKLMVIALHFMKGFMGTLYFQITGETCKGYFTCKKNCFKLTARE